VDEVFNIQLVRVKNPLNHPRTDIEIAIRIRLATNTDPNYSDYYSKYNLFIDLVQNTSTKQT
jgi:hypothetical protein